MTDTRTPPHDLDAERYVLGAMIASRRAVDDVTDILDGTEFYRPWHETVFGACVTLAADGPLDVPRVAGWLQERGETHPDGPVAVFNLVEACTTPTNAAWHARTVATRAAQRKLIAAGQRITELGYAADGNEIDATQEAARAEVDRATGLATSTHGAWIGTQWADTLSALEETPELYDTGWVDIDHMLAGFAPGRLYVVGARPGTGKSVFGIQAAVHHAQAHQRAVLLASLEMSTAEIHMRVASQLAGVSYANLERRTLDERDWSRLAGIGGTVSDLPLVITDRSTMRVNDIRREARRVTRTRPLGMIVVDYLQLMSSPPGRQPRHEVVADFSRSLKLLAKEFHVPVIAMSQLNRGSEARTDKRPTMADLRESGAVEQDSDVVILLHRDRDDPAEADNLSVLIAKNRHGTTGAIDLQFQGHYQRAVGKSWRADRGAA